MENELIEHVIEVDKYTELTLKIPLRMTAMELKGLTMKANKIFNLSDCSDTNTMVKRTYKTRATTPEALNQKQQIAKDHKAGMLPKELALKYNMESKQISTMIYSMKLKGDY